MRKKITFGTAVISRRNEKQRLCKIGVGWGGGGETRCIMGDVQVAYLMKLIKWHFWILKKHDIRIANSFGEILFENPQIYKECIGSWTFCHPVILQFSITAIFFLLLISKSWNLNKLLKVKLVYTATSSTTSFPGFSPTRPENPGNEVASSMG